MKITRKIEMTVAENSIYVIRKSSSSRQTTCAKCAASVLTAEQTARMFGITQRRLFQIIETGAVHFAESELGAMMICITSLATVLEVDKSK